MSRRSLFFTVFFLVYGALTCYIGLRGWQWIGTVAPGPLSALTFWVPLLVIGFSFPVARFLGKSFPRTVRKAMMNVGAYWLFIMFYAFPLLLALDVFRLLNRLFGVVQELILVQYAGGAVLLLLAGLLLYGVWRARTPVVVNYDISMAKRAPGMDELHVVLVSDTHVGSINSIRRLRHMVRMVNALNPDLVLIAGDLTDDELEPFVEENMAEELKKLSPRLGTFSVLGNHDYPAGPTAPFRHEMERAGVHLLIDEWAKVADSFYVIGREDIAGRAYSGRPRKDLHELMEGVDRTLPLILMDHQPYRLEEAQRAGIDLQVSGHTHRGQMFPNHYLTRRTFELDWGYLQKGAIYVVVSLGFGTWGPPVRIGNRPELVSIRVRFSQ